MKNSTDFSSFEKSLPSLQSLAAEKARREAERLVRAGLPAHLRESLERRRDLRSRLSSSPDGVDNGKIVAGERNLAQDLEFDRCRADVVYWFNSWVWTYDPRVIGPGLSSWLPFDLFPRQEECVRWVYRRIENKEEGLCEKSRGVGLTWIMAGIAVHEWIFNDGFKTTFGSRVEQLVDELGNADSIFEKIRLLIYRLPPWMRPKGFQKSLHDNFMRIVNPENGNVIGGGAGENMGRGGRSSLFIVDEAVFVPNAERVEAAISENADCRLWVSTVHGHGNLFAKKRFSGGLSEDQIFRFHWRDDPRRDDAWAEKKKRSLAATPWTWASEFDIDYSASVEGLCIPAAWVDAATTIVSDLKELALKGVGRRLGGGDIGAGRAKSVFVLRHGPMVAMPLSRGDPDTTDTAYWLLDQCVAYNIDVLKYDPLGVGSGVTSIFNKLDYTKYPNLKIMATNVGLPPSETQWEDGQKSTEKFYNSKIEAWWMMRERFKSTYEHSLFLKGKPPEEGGISHPLDELISLPANASTLRLQLSLPKWFRNEKGKMILESKVQLAARGIASPDEADALALTFVPDIMVKHAGYLEMMANIANRRRAAEQAAEQSKIGYLQ